MPRGRPVAVTAEEAAFLLSCGESPEQVLKMLGMGASAVAKACSKVGDLETARRFGQIGKKKWEECA